MMWVEVVIDTMALLKSDTTLTTLLGGVSIYRNQSRVDIQIPSIVWSVISGTVEENYAPVTIQWDIWANDATTVGAIEKRLYQLMHSDTPKQYSTYLMWSQFQARFDFHDADQGVYHSAVEYKYTPPRWNG